MPLTAELEPRVSLMLAVAEQAARIALRSFQSTDLDVSEKADASPVTAVDREIESVLKAEILGHFPSDGLLGEEYGAVEGASGWRWIVDPIDGTVSYAAGVPLFGTLIGLEHSGRIRAGICSMPALGERLWAAEARGAWWERRDSSGATARTPARVRTTTPLANALVCTTGLEYFERAGRTPALVAVARSAGRVRGWSDCYGGMLVATGRADAWFDPIMHSWDSGPFPVIFAEAGGRFSDFSGADDVHGGSVVAAAPELHAELLACIQSSASQDASKANA
ncbi:MAG: Histidinol-phosphatase [Planctomycetota bacterium]|jgi:histidinol phosphatase-like enzyme (inositol monophosphatase family)